MTKPKVLMVEDDGAIVAAVRLVLEDEFDICVMDGHHATMVTIHEQAPLVTLLDVDSPAIRADDGVCILPELRQAGHTGKVIAYTERQERSVAGRIAQQGAYDVLTKPLDLTLLKGITRRAVRLAELEREMEAPEAMAGRGHERFCGMLGTSNSIRRIFDAIRKVSTNDVPILITGEGGTGKELTARAIHDRGLRSHAPFIPINCGAIPESLLEAELFGYERVEVMGAGTQRKGKIELAQGGTLFLDDVDELSNALQVKLLGFLHDHTFERIGGHQPIEMNVRIIAATNVNLKEAVERGTFREDLYYRLGVVHINLPPLRERGEDVSIMAMAFLRQAVGQYDKRLYGFSREALEAMRVYTWPGNVRELSNRVARAAVMAEGTQVTLEDLDLPSQVARQDEGSISFKINQQRIETDLIMKAFTLSQGNLSRAAQELGISRSTLYRRLRQYGMDRALSAQRSLGLSPRTWMTEH